MSIVSGVDMTKLLLFGMCTKWGHAMDLRHLRELSLVIRSINWWTNIDAFIEIISNFLCVSRLFLEAVMAGKVEIEWLEPDGWVGSKQTYPRRQLYGDISVGSEALATYQKKKWRVRIVAIGDRMTGQPPSCTQGESSGKQRAASSSRTEQSLADLLRKDRQKVAQQEAAAEALDKSYELSSEQDEEEEEEEAEEGDDGDGEEVTEEGGDGDGEEEREEGGDGDGEEGREVAAKKTRWRKKGEHKRIIMKRKRISGEEWVNRKGNKRAAKEVQQFVDPCCKLRKCSTKFSAEERQDIFNHFRGLGSFERQSDFILAHATAQQVERHRPRNATKERSVSLTYKFQKVVEGAEDGLIEDIEVCKQFFMGTLAITHRAIRTAVAKSSSSGHCESVAITVGEAHQPISFQRKSSLRSTSTSTVFQQWKVIIVERTLAASISWPT